jgi:large subunit ribosomal protein L23
MSIFGTKKVNKKEKTVKADAKKHVARAKVSAEGVSHDIIRAPWFSEKALLATEKGVYAFAVSPRATKPEIAGAIKEIYNVSPRAIRIVNLPAKTKAMRTRHGVGTRAARTKAYVYLNAGETIQFA